MNDDKHITSLDFPQALESREFSYSAYWRKRDADRWCLHKDKIIYWTTALAEVDKMMKNNPDAAEGKIIEIALTVEAREKQFTKAELKEAVKLRAQAEFCEGCKHHVTPSDVFTDNKWVKCEIRGKVYFDEDFVKRLLRHGCTFYEEAKEARAHDGNVLTTRNG